MAKYQVTVTDVSCEKLILLIKSLQLIADLGLKDAKLLAEFVVATKPCILVAGIEQDVANHVISLLQEAGATAAVEESNLAVPLLLCPQANRRHRWSWLRGPVVIE